MANFTLRPAAIRDLEIIWKYTAETWDDEQADNYIHDLNDGFLLLAQMPFTGKDCSYIREGYRKYPINRHIIFYLVSSNDIEIIRILHERMDVSLNIE